MVDGMAEEDTPVRVILVDDEPDLRILLWLAIEADGRCQVVGDASNGVEGVSLAASAEPDVVVLDQLMPEMDGITAVPLLRQAAPGAKIIMLSALADPVARDRAMDAGADAYVEKSASFQPLLDLAVALARGNAANRN
ncbi:MAG TPA: response regulator transcription factor [Acidimicrobiales bacterium]|nr:response regulator transcription factor [Acidimicrobiales bacterium]